MGILGGLFAGIYGATSGPKRPAAANNTPPINASSSDEADFIKCGNSWSRREKHTLTSNAGSSSRSRRVPRRSNKRRLWRTGVDGLHDALYLYLALGHLLPVESKYCPRRRSIQDTTRAIGMTSNRKLHYYITVHPSVSWVRSDMEWASEGSERGYRC